MINRRIEALDGLRALAALGVLWIHCWTFYGNPRIYLLGVDIASILALGGNGVDLFFVISGFCMYYFYSGNQAFSYADFWRFLKKRWLRLSPAFYTATIIYGIYWTINDAEFSFLKAIVVSAAYLNSLLPEYSSASHFWTLGVEAQFYLVVPFILIYQKKFGFRQVFIVTFLLFLIASSVCIFFLNSKADILSYQLLFRYFEFMWGVGAAYLIANGGIKISNTKLMFVAFILLAYSGRILISQRFLALSASYYNFIRLAGFSIMSLGFGGIVYLSINPQRWLKLLLANKFLSFLGKVSFSFYLWHLLISISICDIIKNQLPGVDDFAGAVLTFSLSTVALLPVSLISYNLLEKPFMAVRKNSI